jgi:hypothetical protein
MSAVYQERIVVARNKSFDGKSIEQHRGHARQRIRRSIRIHESIHHETISRTKTIDRMPELIEIGDLLKVTESETITDVFKENEIVEVLHICDGDFLTYQCANKKGRIGWLSVDEVEIYRTNGRD